ncbi:adenyl-nucleotide exchange factor sse1 [Malassezia vespertilionis]|uniref:Sse1p n=1 Tax=Malassezia vespertilionis TaxID=2020962 RepID=A0A2N1JDS6_9BASI|nr:adenyl-nucleotide exchange factor sse1 [Malassezia vespertilionis]PKI84710.1 Sse1p [Malassezia vespertilionis]WFD05824.1 adenyl-nucleotide exchange factor sse1 [Malassezia vespertilionis]
MSSVVGFDIGNSCSKIGVARARGVDIVANEVSNRSTPSLVSFGTKSRMIGEAAATAQTSNFKNTVGSLKRLVGRKLDDYSIQHFEKPFVNAELVDAGGEVGVKLRYSNEDHVFSATQLLGMFIGKLRDTTQADMGGSAASDVVISVPIWFTDAQRRAMLNAAEIANLNTLRLINEPTAAALGYGITKTDLPEPENPRNVMFVDLGHSSYQVSIVAFSKGQLTVLGASAEPNFGGRDFDRALMQHFAEEFKQKYKIEVFSNPKAITRLAAGCERLKKVLSANSVAQLNVESLMNDIDVSAQFKREQFEELIAPYLERIDSPLNIALEQSGIAKEELHSVEIIGGSSRVPALKERISAWFGRGLSSTLNQDEANVRGDTLACAILSPVFRVREFSVHDISPYPIKVSWKPAPDVPDEDNELVVFNPNNPIPSTKILTFYRKEPFTLDVEYADPSKLPKGANPKLGHATIQGVKPNENGDHSIVKVKARLNLHGIVNIESAYTVDEVEQEEEVPVQVAEGEPPKTEKRIVKKLQRKDDLPVESNILVLANTQLEKYRETENEMHASDRLVADTEDRKNALEEYIYDQRSKLDERLASFVQPEEKTKFLEALGEAEDWLYTEEGEEATKSAYTQRLDKLLKMGAPIAFRWKETDDRSKAAAQLREVVNKYTSVFENESEKYDHLSDDDKMKVIEAAANAGKWLEDMMIKQSEMPKNVDPKLTSEVIQKRKDEVIFSCTPILTKPKPRTSATEPKAEEGAPKEPKPEQAEDDKQGNMDVD